MIASKTTELLIETALSLELTQDKFMWLWAPTPEKAARTERWIAKRHKNSRASRLANRSKLRRYVARLFAVQPLQAAPGDTERLATEAANLGLSIVQVSALSAMTPERRREKLVAHRAFAQQATQSRRRELEQLAADLERELGRHCILDLGVYELDIRGHDACE
jgi:hypothetical protein